MLNLVTCETHIKTTRLFVLTAHPPEALRRTDTTGRGPRCGAPGAPIRRRQRCRPHQHSGNTAGCEHTLRSSKPTLGWKYKRASPKGTYKDVRSSLIQNGRKLKTTQTPVSSRIHEVWNIHKTDLLAKKYERTIGSDTGQARADLLNLHFEQMSTASERHGGPAHYLGHPYTKIYYSIESRH